MAASKRVKRTIRRIHIGTGWSNDYPTFSAAIKDTQWLYAVKGKEKITLTGIQRSIKYGVGHPIGVFKWEEIIK